MPHATVDGYRLAFRDQGSGPAALFIHGFPFDGRMWLDQVERLSDLRRCLVPDLRGFGRSGPIVGDVLTMERHADDLARLLDHLDIEQADIVGLSMGGYVALALADRHPMLVRSLALIDTRAGADAPAAREARAVAAEQAVTEGRAALAANMVSALLAEGVSASVRGRVRTMIEATPYETIVAALAGMAVRPDRSGLLESLAVPAAVIVGAEDRLTPPAEAGAMAAALPDATLTVVPDAGHVSPVEQPGPVAGALRELFRRVDATQIS